MAEDQNAGNEKKTEEHEISNYYEGVKKMEMEGHETGIKKARNALFVTAALFLVWEAIAIGRAGIPLSELPLIYWAIVVAEVGGFIALALWTKTKPYTAIIVGLILFILLWVLAIATAEGTEERAKAITGGIIVRIIILVNLISALKPAKAWEDLNKKG
jgi:hypothetical protein